MNFTQFTEKLERFNSSRIVFVGLGSETRKDDFAGILFIRNLNKTKLFSKSVFIEAGRNPENYLEKIQNADPQSVVFADACDWGGEPGEIKWLNPGEINSISISTHSFSIKMIEQFLSMRNPIEFFYLGIQPVSTAPGKGISNHIKNSLNNFFDKKSGFIPQKQQTKAVSHEKKS
ncbi:MAG TPA: hydrogenase maturation protease [Ignavibacteriaceae bacterium]|nr:hydrogenase maturation protease [Ignavibacteriaceae bacterium]